MTNDIEIVNELEQFYNAMRKRPGDMTAQDLAKMIPGVSSRTWNDRMAKGEIPPGYTVEKVMNEHNRQVTVLRKVE